MKSQTAPPIVYVWNHSVYGQLGRVDDLDSLERLIRKSVLNKPNFDKMRETLKVENNFSYGCGFFNISKQLA